jgi:hypothetical protein
MMLATLQVFDGHSRMILDLLITPKMFFTASTDLMVCAWVYESLTPVRYFKGTTSLGFLSKIKVKTVSCGLNLS